MPPTICMIRVGGRLRCCTGTPASLRFSVHWVVLCMVRVVIYSLQCCFTTSIRLQRVFYIYNLCILPVSSPLIRPKLTFVALPKYERFGDTTGYETVNASRQRSTILVFPSSLSLPLFHPILFFAFHSSKATIHTSKFLQHTSFNRPTFSTPP